MLSGYLCSMPISVRELFTAGNAHYVGAVPWAERVPIDEPGVYCVAVTADPDAATVDSPTYTLSPSAYAELLARRPHLSVDGMPATSQTFGNRLGSFWIPNEPVLYIGLAGSSVQSRIAQYYSTKLGARSPHAGGWWLKTLSNLDNLFVHFGSSEACKASEGKMLEGFAASVRHANESPLLLQDYAAPFANVAVRPGQNKKHGLTNYTSDPASARDLEEHHDTRELKKQNSRPPASRPMPNSSPEHLLFGPPIYSQPVTNSDRTRSNLRIPAASKFAFPQTPAMVTVVLGGQRTNARWRPNGARSGTLSLGVGVMRNLRERDEPVRIGVSGGTYFIFPK